MAGDSLVVARIRFKGKTEQRNPLSNDRVEHLANHQAHEPPFLIFVHCQDRFPVPGYFREAIRFANVYEVQYVLFKA